MKESLFLFGIQLISSIPGDGIQEIGALLIPGLR